ncbi:MAG: sigma-54 dependent transcriptional regulator [Bacteroidales bacterium]|jgi:transcriptional regulator with PAS, ATPase and Fis domain|nr:sigma-54 dependent transcriptional regulator [Bacteroidales bacterium]
MDIQTIKQRLGIIGNAPFLNRAINIAMQVAGTDLSVLVLGESGTGKEFFPKIIHELSPRKHNNYVAINCGAIPEGTIDSELFGHEKGSFTDARESRKGYFEEADGGTIFLDEVAELPLATQVRLLRVLETGEFIKVGSSKVQKTNVRVVAATNINVTDAIARGKFREDLYYRLNAITIQVPPLRERGEDIELLFRKFTTDISEKFRIAPLTLTPQARELLLNYDWKGNVRELKNVAEQLSIVEKERLITVEVLRRSLPEQPSQLPMLLNQSGAASTLNGLSEREILYGILFDMQKDIHELKQAIATGEGLTATPSEKHISLSPLSPLSPLPPEYTVLNTGSGTSGGIIDISPELEEDDLSLDKKEKSLIEKALKRHHGNRRKAAEELGVSERTIYRKIKEYDIDEAKI